MVHPMKKLSDPEAGRLSQVWAAPGGSPGAAFVFAPVPEGRMEVIEMRLDKWLKVSRLIKRRTVANEACDNQRVTVNGRPARASYEVKPGDVLELRFGERVTRVEVLSVADNVGKDAASAMYRELTRE